MKLEDLSICVIFGGQNSEHEISSQSAAYIIKSLREAKIQKIYQLGISKKGECFLFTGDFNDIENGDWLNDPDNQTVLFKLGKDGQGFFTADDQRWHQVDIFLDRKSVV